MACESHLEVVSEVVKSLAIIPISLRRYNITREEFLSQHPEYNKVAVGGLVFDK
jgi:hypothetical protein